MGTITAGAIITKARDILQDTSAVRWTDNEALRWLSEGQRYITLHRPDASSTIGNIQLVGGTRQTLPASALRLLDIVRNMGASGSSPGAPIRMIDRDILDAQVSDWHSQTAQSVIKHYVYDERSPKTFYVFPPATAGIWVEAVWSTAPAELTSTSSAIAIDDIYEPVLLDYLLYRAWSKDAEYAGNAERAAFYITACNNALGIKMQADVAMAPRANTPPASANTIGGMR